MHRSLPDGRARDLPRERLEAYGPEVLSDAELVALLLRTGDARREAREIAVLLLDACGGLTGLARSTCAELGRIPGIGQAKAASLQAACEIGRRLASRRLVRGDAFRGPEDVFRHFHPRLRDAAQERFLVVLLDSRQRILGEQIVSQGTLTASLVHPREVFRPALRAAAAAIVLVHNHPSGDPTPSEEDREVTERLTSAGEILGIRIVDHVVVAERGYCSLREEGLLTDDGAPPGGS